MFTFGYRDEAITFFFVIIIKNVFWGSGLNAFFIFGNTMYLFDNSIVVNSQAYFNTFFFFQTIIFCV